MRVLYMEMYNWKIYTRRSSFLPQNQSFAAISDLQEFDAQSLANEMLAPRLRRLFFIIYSNQRSIFRLKEEKTISLTQNCLLQLYSLTKINLKNFWSTVLF